MSYWTPVEIAMFRELNWLGHKKVKLRKTQWCYNSGDMIRPGKTAESVKVFPSTPEVYSLKLDTPRTFYKCGSCGDCTH